MAIIESATARYKIKDRPLWWIVSWYKCIDTETGEQYYEARGMSKLLSKLLYKTNIFRP